MPALIQPRRSFIFSPGTDPSMFTKALGSGADTVCVELEVCVVPHDNNAARVSSLRSPAEASAPSGVLRRQFQRYAARIVYEFATQPHRDHSVGDATYAEAMAEFGENGVVDVVGILGD